MKNRFESKHAGRFGAQNGIASPVLAFSLLLAGMVLPAQAVNLMLDGTDGSTANDSGTINGIIFNTAVSGAKIGNGDSFLELDITGGETLNNVEAGHNSSVYPGNDEASFNSIQLNAVPVLGVGGQPHFQILLDVNESGGADGLRITKLQFFTSPLDGATYDDGAGPTSPFDLPSVSLGAIVTRLDAGGDNTVTLLDDGTGLNASDMEILIPVAAFAGRSASDYLYLYAEIRDVGGGREIFGVAEGATNFYTGDTIVPEPSASLFALLGAVGLIARRRRS